jgi:DNA-binding response OmpR family regulator
MLPPLILLVEDEPSLRDIISDVVDSAGFRIEVAGNYADGLVLLNASQPAVLIANALLPDGDGHKLAEVARRLRVPTLLISGHPEVMLKAEASGVRFLAKPFGIADLVREMRALIETPATQDARGEAREAIQGAEQPEPKRD